MSTILSILFAVISLGLFFGFTDPVYEQVKELKLKQAEYDTVLTKSKELLTKRQELIAKYNAISPRDRERLEKLLPNNVDNVRLILDIDNIALTYGMTLKNIAIEKASTAAVDGALGPDTRPYGALTLRFTVTSSYENFTKFLVDMENSLRLVDITAINFTTNQDDYTDYTVALKTYWLK